MDVTTQQADSNHESEATPAITVTKPVLHPADGDTADPVLQAIQASKSALRVDRPSPPPAPTATLVSSKTLTCIPQEPCGELTGSIAGQVWCYGYATHQGACVYLSLGGPRTAVEAIRARLSKGQIVNLTPFDSPAIELSAEKGAYTAYMNHIGAAKFTSVILCHRMITDPGYLGGDTTFLFDLDHSHTCHMLYHHITQLVNIAVFRHWTPYLWEAGQAARLIRKTPTGGGIAMHTLVLDTDAWTRLITGGLAETLIRLSA